MNAIFESVKQGRQHSFLNLKVTKKQVKVFKEKMKKKNEISEISNFQKHSQSHFSAFSNFLTSSISTQVSNSTREKCSLMYLVKGRIEGINLIKISRLRNLI